MNCTGGSKPNSSSVYPCRRTARGWRAFLRRRWHRGGLPRYSSTPSVLGRSRTRYQSNGHAVDAHGCPLSGRMAPNPSAPTKYAEATLVEVPLKQLAALQVQQQTEMTSPTVSKHHAVEEGLVIHDAGDVMLSSHHNWDPPRRRYPIYLGGLACLGVAGVGWWLLCEKGLCRRDGPDLSNGCDDSSCPDGAGNATRLLA